jgi:hypothetical protein
LVEDFLVGITVTSNANQKILHQWTNTMISCEAIFFHFDLRRLDDGLA